MFQHTIQYCENPTQKAQLLTALNCVCTTRPYLSCLVVLLKIYVSDTLETAGITQTGRLVINPQFMAQVNLQELAFILAHELMHLVLQTHEREGHFQNHELVNIAHDFIINEDLLDDFACIYDDEDWQYKAPPANGLDWNNYSYLSGWKPASKYSLEELVAFLKTLEKLPKRGGKKRNENTESQPQKSPTRSLSGGGSQGGTLGSLLADAGFPSSAPIEELPELEPVKKPKGKPNLPIWDVLSRDDELEMFPELTLPIIEQEQKQIQETAIRVYTEAILKDAMDKNEQDWRGIGGQAGDYFKNYSRLQKVYQVPWEMAMQRWFDMVTPGDRSFAKASRRGAWRTDVVLPGRKREGWTLHIVLDTSGSMIQILPKALGAIAHFCEANNIEVVRIIQIDTIIHQDEFVEVLSLENIRILGLGGNDMQPAWDRLMEDPEVTAVVVISDGGFSVPPEPPFEVLWAITDSYFESWFNPTYGTVIYIEEALKNS